MNMRRRLVTAETHEMMVDSVLHVPDEAAMQTCKLVKTRNKLVEHIKKVFSATNHMTNSN